ncbi:MULTISPECIES: phosphonate C-P lyase system protein PhnH [Oceanibaculum]|uniref:Carbon-phosphorus lyase complex subunit n=2 Tax=Oceanibaculum indicum TaxID=526216 RepID=K2J0G7_9PROT|nr:MULTISPECIES: phosphonate C-P lyase system protein PhnH [Oceanibaculum]EKE76406.1 carbon-phosphorus lyase complex subunit [Oceanibaculum indicum P24]MCH2395775.1 phosphonate C-P lyase system protein PhnH [Oceanibaculum sp.]RKQ73431.1 alpha-D-ribose 1-methylphosphonate 5-triphosphate synthase subunit PhnH [Oceanibaculum indicum]
MTDTLLAGFNDTTLDSQRAFRAALDALSRPGRIVTMPDLLPDAAPQPLMPATAALALALFDYETPVWLDEAADTPAVRDWLRFHCGSPLVSDKAQARFALLAGTPETLSGFDAGTDAYPDRSATLIRQVESLSDGPAYRLSGPGIAQEETLKINALHAGFDSDWQKNAKLFPRGLDLFLVAGHQLAGLPRTTRIDRMEG